MEPLGTRRVGRPSVSCSVCKKRKLKCNRESPCSNCLRSRSKNPREECIYEDTPTSSRPRRRAQSLGNGLQLTPDGLSPASCNLARPSLPSACPEPSPTLPRVLPTADCGAQRPHYRHLEEQESVSPDSTPARGLPSYTTAVVAAQSPASETIQSQRLAEHGVFGETTSLAHGIAHKTRLFGQSHWITAVAFFRDLMDVAASHLADGRSKAGAGMRRCKSVAKGIKAKREPAWPTPPTAALPSRTLADELVEAYLRTTESVYRILHVPSFRRDYDTIWLSSADATPDSAFLVQVKLVLAIGAITYDARFSLRESAIRWIYEAQTYLSEPNSKSRLGLQSLQTNILLLLAREATGIDGDSVWVSAGALIRSAMHIGLHRDPTTIFATPRPRVTTEMRRRLWNTILEIALQSALASGKPPLISLGEFDTQPPSNFTDDQLMTESEDATVQKDSDLTNMTIAIALRTTFPLRLKVAKLLNDPGAKATYEETLKLDADLRASYKAILPRIQPSSGSAGPLFGAFSLDVIMHRYIVSLHLPFLETAFREMAYAYSRRVAVDSALRIWYAVDSPSHSTGPGFSATSQNASSGDFSRFTICGSGFFRTAAFLANLVLAAELKAQLREEAGLGPVMLRPDLLAVLETSKVFSLRCIEAGETSVKGYLLNCLAASQIEGLREVRGEGRELKSIVLKAADDAIERSLQVLEEMLAGVQATGDTGYGMMMNTPSETADDWDPLMSDIMFNPGHNGMTDPVTWMLMDDVAPETASW